VCSITNNVSVIYPTQFLEGEDISNKFVIIYSLRRLQSNFDVKVYCLMPIGSYTNATSSNSSHIIIHIDFYPCQSMIEHSVDDCLLQCSFVCLLPALISRSKPNVTVDTQLHESSEVSRLAGGVGASVPCTRQSRYSSVDMSSTYKASEPKVLSLGMGE
jgi:hypothetical protein